MTEGQSSNSLRSASGLLLPSRPSTDTLVEVAAGKTVALEVEACRNRWPGGLVEVAREINVTRVDQYAGMRPRSIARLALFWASVSVMVVTGIAILVVAVLTFPLVGTMSLQHGYMGLIGAIVFICCLPFFTALCSDDAFSRGSRAIDVVQNFARRVLVGGSALYSGILLAVWAILEFEGAAADFPAEALPVLFWFQIAVAALASVGLAMAPPMLVIRREVSQLPAIHAACSSLCLSVMVLFVLGVLTLFRDVGFDAVPLALAFTVTSWILVQLATARRDLGESWSEVLDVLTELEISMGRVRVDGAGAKFAPEVRESVLRLQSLIHKKSPGLVPGGRGRSRVDHAITVAVDYIAVRSAGERPTALVAARKDFFRDRLGSASQEEMQYLTADFISALRRRCIARPADVEH